MGEMPTICLFSGRPHGVRTRDQRIKRPLFSTRNPQWFRAHGPRAKRTPGRRWDGFCEALFCGAERISSLCAHARTSEFERVASTDTRPGRGSALAQVSARAALAAVAGGAP